MKEFLKRKNVEFSAKRYGIDALGAMAQGLFASLLIGTIISTLGQQIGLEILVTIGNYAKAAKELANPKGCPRNTVLAYILNNELDKAAAAATCPDPKVQYLKAIIAARQGKTADVKENLAKAAQNAELAARVAKDIEFAGFSF